MTRVLAFLLAALALVLPGTAARAQQGARVVASVSWVEEWDPVSRQWVRVDDHAAAPAPAVPAAPAAAGVTGTITQTSRSGAVTITETITETPVRFIPQSLGAAAPGLGGMARFGPFRVIDGQRAALVAATDAASPRDFAAMLAAWPDLEVIEFADAPGTSHDLANLALGRAIRAAGLATHVPAGGSARSGAVELFLAGTRRTIDPGALFAVHSWRDEAGREPGDFAPDAPENRLYLDYYAEMGMTPEDARAFYAMTNSVPHAGALWLDGAQMARWIAPRGAGPRAPASRALGPRRQPAPRDTGLLAALAQPGVGLTGGVAGGLAASLRAPFIAGLAPRAPAPRLALAEGPASLLDFALLDSGAAFP